MNLYYVLYVLYIHYDKKKLCLYLGNSGWSENAWNEIPHQKENSQLKIILQDASRLRYIEILKFPSFWCSARLGFSGFNCWLSPLMKCLANKTYLVKQSEHLNFLWLNISRLQQNVRRQKYQIEKRFLIDKIRQREVCKKFLSPKFCWDLIFDLRGWPRLGWMT